MRADLSAQNVTERAPHGNGRTKNRQDAPAFLDWESIGQNRRRRRSVTAFADPDENARAEKNREAAGETRSRRSPDSRARPRSRRSSSARIDRTTSPSNGALTM